jgi:Zn-dependent protease with chaperone function
MKWLVAIVLVLGCGLSRGDDAALAPANSADIVAVLHASQQLRLDALALADPGSPRARRLRESFDVLTRGLHPMPRLELRIVRAEIVAETLQGHIVVVNEALGDWPQSEQLFVLGHELGHVLLGHWAQLGTLYRKWVPGPVTQPHTDAVADALGQGASALAHRHEFEADAFALHRVCALGGSVHDVVAAFMRTGARSDTATHPATRKRVAALRAVESERLTVAATGAAQRPAN